MLCFARRALPALFLAMLSFPLFSSHAEEPMATQPEECVFFGTPPFYQVDCVPEQDLFLMVNWGSLRAFDTRSGATRWRRVFGSWGRVCYGRERILFHTDQELFLLDKNSGRELWRRQEDKYGRIDRVLLAPDENHVMAVFNSDLSGRNDSNVKSKFTYAFYDLGSQRRRVFTEMENDFPRGFLPDGKTVLSIRAKTSATESSAAPPQEAPLEFFTMDLVSGETSEGHDLYGCYPAVVSASGLLPVYRAREGGPTGIKMLDAKTGALLRDLGEIPGQFYPTAWSADEACLYAFDGYRKEVCVIDAQTGVIKQTLSRPGHELLRVLSQRPGNGPDRVLSQDEDRNIWYWPLVPDAEPTRVFDGRRLSPGDSNGKFGEGGVLTARIWRLGETVLGVYCMENMQKMREWRFSNKFVLRWADLNRTLTHCACTFFDPVKDGTGETEHIEVYAKDAESPLYSCKGTTIALSPDGRYLVLGTSPQRAELLDLQEKRTLHVFDSETESCMVAVFSDNGRRVAINASPNLEVVDLVEGYPRRSMVREDDKQGFICPAAEFRPGRNRNSEDGHGLCFSPDGTFLLSGSYSGRAWLHDAGTGALLHTFTEPKRFLNASANPRAGFLNTLAQSAKDWAGMVTDRYNRADTLYVAFGAFGDHVITHTAGQIIRVWDARSGELINTVETGMPEKRARNGDIRNEIVLSNNGDYAFVWNRYNFAPGCLWSLMDRALIRRYELPDYFNAEFALPDDAKSVYVLSYGGLYRWPGRPKDAL